MLGQQMFVASEASWEALQTCCSSFILLWVQLLVLQKPVRLPTCPLHMIVRYEL